MSYRHWRLDMLGPNLSQYDDFTLNSAIEDLVTEHQAAAPSIEDRAARAEAFAIFALEKIRRLETLPHSGGKQEED